MAFALETKLEYQEYSPSVTEKIITDHRKVLLTKTMNSLNRITPKMFEKVNIY